VGIYAGWGTIVHAASRGPETGVIVSALSETYYRTRALGARRVLEYTRPTLYATIGDTRIRTALKAPFGTGEMFRLTVRNKRPGERVVILARDPETGSEEKVATLDGSADITIERAFAQAGPKWIVVTTADQKELVRIEVMVEERTSAPGREDIR